MQAAPPTIPPTDAELILRFCGHRDDDAFRLLVERHAGLVLTVCRRVLVNRQDVEDAFQATFLVLARQAGTLRNRDSIASWLFKVAHRTAVRAARESRDRSECRLAEEVAIPSEPLARLQERETFELLAAELNRLPESYRAPLILFYLEGKTRQAAADELDVSDAALKARLARGRRILRRRLMRRGVALSLVMGAVTLAGTSSEAAAATALIEQTIAAGLSYAATGTTSAACSAHTVSLAKGVQPMLSTTLTKPVLAAGVLLAASVLAVIGVGPHLSTADAEAGSRRQQPGDSAQEIQTTIAGRNAAGTTDTPAHISLPDGGAVAATAGDPAGGNEFVDPAEQSLLQKKIDQLVAARWAGGKEPFDLSERSPLEIEIEDALASPTEIEFIDTPLHDALDFMADLHKIKIILDETALTEGGIAADEPISQVISGIPLHSVLGILFKPLDLTYVIEDDVMKVTTKTAEMKRLETRAYTVQSLVDAGFEAEELAKVIEEQGEGKVKALNGVLIVTQPQRTHQKTMRLLKQLQLAADLRAK